MNIKVEGTHLVLYSPGIVIVDKLKVASDIRERAPKLFEGDPVILPLSENMPPEIPRIQMNSKDGRYNLSITGNRIDFVFRYKEDEKENLFPIPGLFENFLTIFQYFKENICVRITRTAIVTSWIIELEKSSSAEFILEKYIRNETPIVKPYELELSYLTREVIAGFEVNKWTRIRSARKISVPEENKFISSLIDINTLADITYDFNKESLQRFLEESAKVMNETLEKHLKLMGA